ncbi:MAG: DNA polymerase III subunit delta [bacterium]
MAQASTVDLYQRLLRDVEQGRLLPIYFFAGAERLLMDRLVAAIRRAALSGAAAEFNHDQVGAKEAGAGQIVQLARTVPMMGERRLVEVRDADGLSAKDHEQLLPYVAAPVDSSVLVFTATKVDGRLKFFKALDKAGYLCRFEPVRGAPLLRFLDAEAKRLGARLGPGVAELVVELVGSDFLALASAVEKLCLFVGAGGVVQAEQVDAVVAQTRQAVIFELTDAVGEGNVGSAMRSLRSLLVAGEPEQRILFMIARQFRLIWRALDALSSGARPGDLAGVIGVPPFIARKIASQAGRFDASAVHAAHEEIYSADRALKSSRVPRGLILERLVIGLCSR